MYYKIIGETTTSQRKKKQTCKRKRKCKCKKCKGYGSIKKGGCSSCGGGTFGGNGGGGGEGNGVVTIPLNTSGGLPNPLNGRGGGGGGTIKKKRKTPKRKTPKMKGGNVESVSNNSFFSFFNAIPAIPTSNILFGFPASSNGSNMSLNPFNTGNRPLI
jgi:hypothetical protein